MVLSTGVTGNHIVLERFWNYYVDEEIKKMGDDRFVNLFNTSSDGEKTEKTYEQIYRRCRGT